MQKILGLLLLSTLITACGDKTAEKVTKKEIQTPSTEEKISYPKALNEILGAHGGLDRWRSKRSLVFKIPRTGYDEKHTVDLLSRKDRIDTPVYSIGFDGENTWLFDEDGEYEGDPVFYHNLMFYFFAMPYVLADDGIVYHQTEDLVFEGRNYPGLRIGYEAGVGTSPKDEYFVYYDPNTMQMAWLGYTVTYRTGEKSDKIKWIRYNSWQEVDGLFLPESIIWYNYEGRDLKEPKNSLGFRDVEISEKPMSAALFKKPEKAVFVEGENP